MSDGSDSHLVSLASLRGWAILLVMAVHFSEPFSGLPAGIVPLAVSGARGVQLFFVLSAFTLCMSWARSQESVPAFYIRRLFRIGPMYWLAILVFAVVLPDRPAPLGYIAANATFLHGLVPPAFNSVVPGGWSIAVEMTFYLIFPLVFGLCRHTYRTVAIVGALFVICSVSYSPLVSFCEARFGFPRQVWGDYFFLYFPNQLPAFLWGGLAYYAYKSGVSKTFVSLPGALVAVAVLIYLPHFDLFRSQRIYVYEPIFAYLLLCAIHGKARFLVGKWIAFMGERSFSGYLVHFFVLNFVFTVPVAGRSVLPLFQSVDDGLLGYVGFFPIFVLVTMLLSAATYRYIELPTIRFGTRLAKTLPPRRGASSLESVGS